MFGLSGLAGRIAQAVLYGVVVYIVVYIIGLILIQVPGAVAIGDFLKHWAPLLGLLAGIAAFFGMPHRTV